MKRLHYVASLALVLAGAPAMATTYQMYFPKATLKVTSSNPTPQTSYDLSAGRIDFGGITDGNVGQATFAVLNTGETPLSVPAPAVTGAAFSASYACLTLAPGDTCPVTVVFKPTAPQDYTGLVALSILQVGNKSVTLSGTGLGALFAPADGQGLTAVLPDTSVGASASTPASVLFTNTGNIAGNLATPTLQGANAADFTLASGCAGSVAPGTNCAVTVGFTPHAAGSRIASFTLAGSTISLQGQGIAVPAFDLSTTGFDFGVVAAGTTAQSTMSLHNTGQTTLTMPTPQVQGAGYTVTPACTTVAPGAICGVTVAFAPTDAQSYPGTVSFTVSGAGTKSFTVSGTGQMAKLVLAGSPATTFSYPSTAVGSPSTTPMTVTLTNTGNTSGSLATPSIAGANPGDFQITSNCNSVQPNASCAMTVSFVPTAQGARAASVTIAGTAFQLQGTATAPVVYATWDPANSGASVALSNGNLTVTTGADGSVAHGVARATVGKSSGKWYWEFTYQSYARNNIMAYGLVSSTAYSTVTSAPMNGSTYGTGYRLMYGTGFMSAFGAVAPSSSNFATTGTHALQSVGATAGDVFGFALDMDNKTYQIYYKRAGGACEGPYATWTGIPAGTYYPTITAGNAGAVVTATNFGQNTFACTPPAGYQALH